MSSGKSVDDAVDVKSGRELVQLGADTLASAAGGAAGAFLGPVGAVAGAAGTPALVRLLGSAGRAIQGRLLTRNEEVRIGGALAVALARIEEREAAGEQPRKDGLSDPGTDPRGVLEGTLLSAARSYDQKKVPFIGAFYASFVFEEKVSINAAHFLLNLLDSLTYHHLCALAYFADLADDDRMHSRVATEASGARMSPMLVAEITELSNMGLLGLRQANGAVLPFGSTWSTIGGGASVDAKIAGVIAPLELGTNLVCMAELDKIPDADKQGIGTELRGATT